MKINGKEIFQIVTHSNVLIEKTIIGLSFPDHVPVYHNFEYDKLIGVASLKKEGSKNIHATIHLFADIKGFPAVGYTQADKKIYCVSIGSTLNKDKTLKPIL